MGRREFKAMGTTISLLLPIEQAEAGEQLVRALFNVWESTLSRFLPESELSQLNRQPGVPTIVSELLLNTLETALTAAHATEGIYDPTLLEQLIHLGYDRTFEAIAPRQDKPEIGGFREDAGEQSRSTGPRGVSPCPWVVSWILAGSPKAWRLMPRYIFSRERASPTLW
ncbi:hypothetical protein KSB_81950 [Ktedonobacter robiniae]|uniref:FAD:protein FMN transferase n=2 Tax=Ktedonobacter robiniae TaxID=2778365 RepID=A0ABQ3V546_9CHLR|nr:hypothetical protein KSB_81950 [Ktedonobacter robiniae]